MFSAQAAEKKQDRRGEREGEEEGREERSQEGWQALRLKKSQTNVFYRELEEYTAK